MAKNIKIDDKTHAKLKKFASDNGMLLAVLADRLLNEALKSPKIFKGNQPQ